MDSFLYFYSSKGAHVDYNSTIATPDSLSFLLLLCNCFCYPKYGFYEYVIGLENHTKRANHQRLTPIVFVNTLLSRVIRAVLLRPSIHASIQ